MNFDEFEPREIELAKPAPAPVAPIRTGFSWGGFAGGLAALMWLGGAIGAPFSLYGAEGLAQLNPAMQAGLVALAFGPAVLLWLTASALAESVKARRAAMALARNNQTSIIPHVEVQAQRLSTTVRSEVESLNDAVSAALARLDDLESSAQRNAAAFAQALAETRASAIDFMGDLTRERDAFVGMNEELKQQTEMMANQVGRQIRLMREASKLVQTEMANAEDALESHLIAFDNSAHVMAERTEGFKVAAEAARHSSHHISATMGSVLDGLTEATKLTDAARRAAENATAAAGDTANAVLDTTQRAVAEAKRAAAMIRAESEAMMEGARATMMTLKEAAEAARDASEHSQAAADRHAASIEKRLGALAATAATKRVERPVERVVERPMERQMERQAIERKMRMERVANESYPERGLHTAAAETMERVEERRAVANAGGRGYAAFTAFSDWKAPKRAPIKNSAPVNLRDDDDLDAFSLADFGAPEAKDPDAALKRAALELIDEAGVSLEAALDDRTLDVIAQRSRGGAQGRRRAVADAAPGAVGRIARYVKRNGGARSTANQFRARPDLARNEDRNSELTRAYLLIDAALD